MRGSRRERGVIVLTDDALIVGVLSLWRRGKDTVEIARVLMLREEHAYALLVVARESERRRAAP